MQPTQARSEVRLPRSVVRQSERIAARIAERNTPPEDPNPADPADLAATPPALAADPGALPVDPPADPRHVDPAYWKSRFDNTAGVLAAVRREHTATVADLKGQIVELERKTSTLEAALAATPVADPPLDVKEFFTAEQIDQYGEDQCRIMITAAAKAALKVQKTAPAAPTAPPASAEPAPAAPAKSAKQVLMEKLDELLPEWRAWDVDPRMAVWLAEEENAVPRQAVLNVHIGNGDAPAIVKLYERWDREMQAPPTARRAPPVSPSGSGAAPGSNDPPPAPANMRVPTAQEVKDYFKRAALGKVSDKERTEFEPRLKLRNPGR